MRTVRLAVGVLGVLLALACSSAMADEMAVKDGQKIAFLGDSITQYGWERPGGYVKLVVAGLAADGVKVTPIPAGISGNTSREMLHRLDRDVLKAKPDWMTLSCGVNDVWHGKTGVELDQYKKNIADIVDRATAAGIKVIILTSTPIGEDSNDNNKKLADYNEYLRQLAKEKKLPLVDLAATFDQTLKAKPAVPGTTLLTVDGVHMNPAGNVLMAKGVLKALGVPEADFAKVDAAWNSMPDTGLIEVSWRSSYAGITLGEYHTLEAAAAQRNTNPSNLANTLYLDSVREVLKAHEKDDVPDLGKLQNEVRIHFEEHIKALK
jgi:lysophospholipase L1-like esterase